MPLQCHKAKNFVPGKEAQSTKVQRSQTCDIKATSGVAAPREHECILSCFCNLGLQYAHVDCCSSP